MFANSRIKRLRRGCLVSARAYRQTTVRRSAGIKRLRRGCLVSALFVSHVAGATGAHDASAHFERGLAFTEAGEIAAAAEEFRLANEASPHPSSLFNWGRSLTALGKPVEAVEALRTFLQLSTSIVDPRRTHAESLIRANEDAIGFVTLETDPLNAEVLLDGRSIGRGPFPQPRPLAQGKHSVVTLADERIVDVREISVEPRSSVTLRIALRAIAVASTSYEQQAASTSTSTEVQAPRARSGNASTSPSWRTGALVTVSAGAGLVLAGGAVALARTNSARYREWQAERAKLDARLAADSGPDLVEQNRRLTVQAVRIERADRLALGLGIGGAMALGLAGVLWFTSSSEPPSRGVFLGVGRRHAEIALQW